MTPAMPKPESTRAFTVRRLRGKKSTTTLKVSKTAKSGRIHQEMV
jgi:hypothetical protein